MLQLFLPALPWWSCLFATVARPFRFATSRTVRIPQALPPNHSSSSHIPSHPTQSTHSSDRSLKQQSTQRASFLLSLSLRMSYPSYAAAAGAGTGGSANGNGTSRAPSPAVPSIPSHQVELEFVAPTDSAQSIEGRTVGACDMDRLQDCTVEQAASVIQPPRTPTGTARLQQRTASLWHGQRRHQQRQVVPVKFAHSSLGACPLCVPLSLCASAILRSEADEFGLFAGCPEFGTSSGEFLCTLCCLVSGHEKLIKQAGPLVEQLQHVAARYGAGAQPRVLLKFFPAPKLKTLTATAMDAAASSHASSHASEDELKEEQAQAATLMKPRSAIPFQRPSPSSATPSNHSSTPLAPTSSAAKRKFSQMHTASTCSDSEFSDVTAQQASSAAGSAGVGGSLPSQQRSGRLSFSPDVDADRIPSALDFPPSESSSNASSTNAGAADGETDAQTESAETGSASAAGISLRVEADPDPSFPSPSAVLTLCRLSCKAETGTVKLHSAYPVGTVLAAASKTIKHGPKSKVPGIVLQQPASKIVASDPFSLPENVLGPDACPSGLEKVHWPTEILSLCFPSGVRKLEAVVCADDELELRLRFYLSCQSDIDQSLAEMEKALPMRSTQTTARLARCQAHRIRSAHRVQPHTWSAAPH